jgi:hypothetical protein
MSAMSVPLWIYFNNSDLWPEEFRTYLGVVLKVAVPPVGEAEDSAPHLSTFSTSSKCSNTTGHINQVCSPRQRNSFSSGNFL